jgi:aminoglycoside phosphotransferase (APT) family kinase protein
MNRGSAMDDRIKELLKNVQEECQGRINISDIEPFAFGVENCVFKGYSPEWGQVAIRTPWSRQIDRETDTITDSRLGLLKEHALTAHSRRYGLPVPAICRLHLGETADFLVQEFVEGDQSVSIEEIGRIAKELHSIEILPETGISEQDVHQSLADRIASRAKAAERVLKCSLPLPDSEDIFGILSAFKQKKRLLHMDLRPENLIFQEGKAAAVIDWTNALIGDPVLELMRIKDYGLLTDEFLRGYGGAELEIARVPEAVQFLYQLDTAAMLTVLFYTEIKDPVQGEEAGRRVKELQKKIVNLL